MLLGSNVYVQRFVQAMDLPPQDLVNYEILICVDGSVDTTVLRFNSPAEPACIFYDRTDPAGELKCKGRFSFSTLLSVTTGRREK